MRAMPLRATHARKTRAMRKTAAYSISRTRIFSITYVMSRKRTVMARQRACTRVVSTCMRATMRRAISLMFSSTTKRGGWKPVRSTSTR